MSTRWCFFFVIWIKCQYKFVLFILSFLFDTVIAKHYKSPDSVARVISQPCIWSEPGWRKPARALKSIQILMNTHLSVRCFFRKSSHIIKLCDSRTHYHFSPLWPSRGRPGPADQCSVWGCLVQSAWYCTIPCWYHMQSINEAQDNLDSYDSESDERWTTFCEVIAGYHKTSTTIFVHAGSKNRVLFLKIYVCVQ